METRHNVKVNGTLGITPKTSQATGYVSLLSFLRAGIGNDPNARDGYVNKRVQETLRERPEDFSKFNSGVVVTCRAYEENPDGTVTIVLRERDTVRETTADDGTCDGGSSVASARALVEELTEVARTSTDGRERQSAQTRLEKIAREALLRIELIPGLTPSMVREVSEKRNTNVKVKPKSLLDNSNAFQPIKDTLGEHAVHVSFYENDTYSEDKRGSLALGKRVKKPVDVTDLLKLLVAAASENPHKSYAGIGSAQQEFAEVMANPEDPRHGYYRFATGDLWRLIRLKELMVERFSRWAETKRKTVLSNLDKYGMKVAGKSENECFFTKRSYKYEPGQHILLPLYGAICRTMMDARGWDLDPEKFFEEHADELCEIASETFKRKPVTKSDFGKSKEYWDAIYEEVAKVVAKASAKAA